MRKYIAPRIHVVHVEHKEMLMALSLKQDSSDDTEVLSKRDDSWDIWNTDDEQ